MSEPIPVAARIDAFEADTIENTAPATISACPGGPRNPSATSPIAVSPSSATISGGTVEFVMLAVVVVAVGALAALGARSREWLANPYW